MLSTGGSSTVGWPRTRLIRRWIGGRRQVLRALVAVGGDHRQADHDMRLLEIFGRLEEVAMDVDRLHQALRREMAGEGEGQAEHAGELRREGRGAEQPDRHVRAGTGHGAHALHRA